MKYLSNILLIFTSCVFLTACQSGNKAMKGAYSDSIAEKHGFTKKLVKGGDFWITIYQRIQNKNVPYVFYLEGDGFAYSSRYTISSDPTPVRPMLLKLATLDGRPNVVYISRPCQFTAKYLNPKCENSAYWTNLRMSDEVVTAINDAINFVNNDSPFSLIGYSGGGGIAVMIAAKNKLAKDIITISGNLDITSFKQHHNVQPMIGSSNPIDYAPQTRNIPQLHLSGGKDEIVPPFIADRFLQASKSVCVHQEIIDGATHSKGWEGAWQYVLSIPLVCQKY